jgi:2-amino-4-hydroxy-6-hydroxymethyldihydropteridine diphosphokinase
MKSQPSITFEESDTLISIVGLGSNLDSRNGSKLEIIRKAINSLEELCSRSCIISSFYESEPEFCPPDSPIFVNLVIVLFLPVDADPMRFFRCVQRLEEKLGRVRSRGINEPRPIDIDLLFFGKKSISSEYLTIPHPRALKRRFVLEPLAEIAPDLILPGQEFSVVELLSRLPKNGWVRKFRAT